MGSPSGSIGGLAGSGSGGFRAVGGHEEGSTDPVGSTSGPGDPLRSDLHGSFQKIKGTEYGPNIAGL